MAQLNIGRPASLFDRYREDGSRAVQPASDLIVVHAATESECARRGTDDDVPRRISVDGLDHDPQGLVVEVQPAVDPGGHRLSVHGLDRAQCPVLAKSEFVTAVDGDRGQDGFQHASRTQPLGEQPGWLSLDQHRALRYRDDDAVVVSGHHEGRPDSRDRAITRRDDKRPVRVVHILEPRLPSDEGDRATLRGIGGRQLDSSAENDG